MMFKPTFSVYKFIETNKKVLENLFKSYFLINYRFLNNQKLDKFNNLKEEIKIRFLLENGKKIEANANENDTLLDVIVNNDIEINGYGACGGTASCSTCHLIFSPQDFAIVGEASGDEADMLDLTKNCTETSRLGCQVLITKKMNNFEIKIPSNRTDVRGNE